MIKNMSNVLKVDPRECHFKEHGEVAPDWFNLMFELPNKKTVLDVLCLNALEKAPWLAQCGVKAVKIGDKSEIYMQSPITRSVPTSIAEADLPCAQGRMLLLCSIIFHLQTACTSSKFMPLSWYRGLGGEWAVRPPSGFCQWASWSQFAAALLILDVLKWLKFLLV